MDVYTNCEVLGFTELINRLRVRPQMFLDSVTLNNIHIFICGYSSFYTVNRGREFSLYLDFSKWIIKRDKLKFSSLFYWPEYINDSVGTEVEAIEKFFIYMEQYLEHVKRSLIETQ